MRRLILIACGLALSASAAAAQINPPARKPGLWKQTMTSTKAGQKPQAMASTLCLDAATDKRIALFGSGVGQQVCSSNKVTKTPAGYSFSSTCSMGGAGTIKTTGTAKGDFSKAYSMQMNSVTTGAAMAQMNGASTTTVTATWAGACPAGQKPGDMVMNGMTMNVLALMKR
jgi:hypothetical protein